jgi:polyferredoxin
MDKVGYPRGLVKYSTENAIQQHWTRSQTVRHVLRPRILIYSAILGAVVLAMVVSLATRTPFKVDVDRDRGALAREVEGGRVENVFRLQIMNATETSQRFHLSVDGIPGVVIASETEVLIESTQSRWVPVRVQIPFGGAEPGSHPIHFEITGLDTPGKLSEKSVFIVPR